MLWLLVIGLLLVAGAGYRHQRETGTPVVIIQPPVEAQSPAPRTPPVPMTHAFSVPVLVYHFVDNPSDVQRQGRYGGRLATIPKDFEEQIKLLKARGYTFVRADDVATAVRHRASLPTKAVAITMDDGYSSVYHHAYPILRRYGVPATVFIVTSKVGDAGHVSWDEMAEMHENGIEFESHTVHHLDLTMLPVDVLDYELGQSKRTLEARLLDDVSSIAYPAGRYDEMVMSRMASAGYTAGWRKDGGPVRPHDNVYALPRISIRGDPTLQEFEHLVTGL